MIDESCGSAYSLAIAGDVRIGDSHFPGIRGVLPNASAPDPSKNTHAKGPPIGRVSEHLAVHTIINEL